MFISLLILGNVVVMAAAVHLFILKFDPFIIGGTYQSIINCL